MKRGKHNDVRRVTEAALEAVGIRYEFDVSNGGHGKITFNFAGKNHVIFFSSTTSDWRAQHKQKAFMRRKLIEIGALAA